MGIPDYRLPRAILREEVDRIERMGATFNYETTVGKDVKLSQLEADNDAVFIAIGSQLGTTMGVEGEEENYDSDWKWSLSFTKMPMYRRDLDIVAVAHYIVN